MDNRQQIIGSSSCPWQGKGDNGIFSLTSCVFLSFFLSFFDAVKKSVAERKNCVKYFVYISFLDGQMIYTYYTHFGI